MALFLLDTNVLVALIRGKALGAWIDAQYQLRAAAERPVVCVVTVGEIRSLARQFKWGEDKRKALNKIVEELVIVDIHSEDMLAAYEEIDSDGVLAGQKIGKNDIWIAAASRVTQRSLLTTDTDFLKDHLKKHIKVIYVDPAAVSKS